MIIRGWKRICQALDGVSEPVARKLMRTEGLPVTFVGGKPTTTIEALSGWVSKRCQDNTWHLGRNQTKPDETRRNLTLPG